MDRPRWISSLDHNLSSPVCREPMLGDCSVRNQPSRVVPLVLGFLVGMAPWGRAQPPEPAKAQPPQKAADLPSPPPIKDVPILPTLKTIPLRHGRADFNVQMVDASLLPRDKEGIWVLDFAFKPVRLITAVVPGKGRRQIHYLYYRVVNHTGKPRPFVPQFTLVTDTGKRYEDRADLPFAVPLIQNREDPSIPLLGAV